MATLKLTVGDVVRDLDMSKFRLSEADDLMRLTGWSRPEWITALFEDHPDATRFAWMIANRRAGTPLEGGFKDIDFDLGDFTVDVIPDEESTEVEGAEAAVPTSPAAE